MGEWNPECHQCEWTDGAVGPVVGARFEPTPTGTSVTESYEVVSMPRSLQLLHHLPGMDAKARRDALSNMTRTLERLRIAAEKG
jgi:hypothetical protein